MTARFSSVWFLIVAIILCIGAAFCSCGSSDDDDSANESVDDDASDDDLNDDLNDDIDDDDGADDDMDDDVTPDDDLDDDADDDADDDTSPDDDIDDDTDDDNDDDTFVDDDSAQDDDTTTDDDADDDTAIPACDSYGSAQKVGTLDVDGLDETSGLAVSKKNPGVLWAHNDSGDGPYIYATNLQGDYLGTVTLTGAVAVDWEDMAAGDCGDGSECLYIGDIGDNGDSRTDCCVYRVPEPEVDPLIPFDEMSVSLWDRFYFQYPDGPQDAESLAVHPGGDLYIFAKYPGGTSKMFAFPPLTGKDAVSLTYIGDLDTGTVTAFTTAADIHRSGDRLLIRTYLSAIEWRLQTPGDSFENIIYGDRSVVPTGLEIQGEAIAYDPATGNYFHASEGSYPKLFRVPCDDR